MQPGCTEALSGEPLNTENAEHFIRKRYFFINFDVPEYPSLSEYIRKEHPLVWKVSGFYADLYRLNEETGETVSMEVLMKVCKTLGCDIGDIMELIPTEEDTV